MALSPALKDAVNNVRSQAEKMQAIITIADELDKIGGLEQAAAEAEGRKVTAEADLKDVKAKIEVEQANLAGATKKVADAKDKAAKIIDDANAEAADIVAQARQDAATATAKGKADADAALDKIKAQATAATGKLADINAAIDEATKKLEATRAEEAEVMKRAAEAKAYLAKLAGG